MRILHEDAFVSCMLQAWMSPPFSISCDLTLSTVKFMSSTHPMPSLYCLTSQSKLRGSLTSLQRCCLIPMRKSVRFALLSDGILAYLFTALKHPGVKCAQSVDIASSAYHTLSISCHIAVCLILSELDSIVPSATQSISALIVNRLVFRVT